MSEAQLETYFTRKGKFSISHEQVLAIIRSVPAGLSNEEVWDLLSPKLVWPLAVASDAKQLKNREYSARRQVDGRCSELQKKLGLVRVEKYQHTFPDGSKSKRSRYIALEKPSDPIPTENEKLRARIAALELENSKLRTELDTLEAKYQELWSWTAQHTAPKPLTTPTTAG